MSTFDSSVDPFAKALRFASSKRLKRFAPLNITKPSWKSWRPPKKTQCKNSQFFIIFALKRDHFTKEKRGSNRLQVASCFEGRAVSGLMNKWLFDRNHDMFKNWLYFFWIVTSFLTQTNSFEFHYSMALAVFFSTIALQKHQKAPTRHHQDKRNRQKHLQSHHQTR